MTSKIHRAHRRETRINLSAIATISLLLGACGGGGGSGAPPHPMALTHCNQSRVISPSAAGKEHLAAAASTNFASCLTAPGANVEVGSAGCPSPVLVQSSATAGTITVDAGATLSFADSTLTLNTTGIVVNGAVQACYIGQNSHTNQVTINFTGVPPAPPAGCPGSSASCHAEGITVNSGGTLALEGVKGAVPFGGTSWTVLSCPAGPTTFGPGNGVASPVLGANGACPGGPLTLQVAASVATDWQPGDWIVVGTTDFGLQNSEFVQIATLAATAAGTTITLDSKTPLTQYHFGGAQPDPGAGGMMDDYTKNYGIDERAEVGLITRNVKLTSTVTTSALHWGGEIDLDAGSMARLTGVEIEKFGKPQLGSYPINLIGNASLDPPPGKQAPNIMDSDSIHHSYNHAVVLSGASGLNFANNVVARAVGSLYYLADGNEVNNQFTNNLGLGAMGNAFAILQSTLAKGYTPASAAAQFWWVGDYLTNNPANPACSMTGGESPCYNGYDGFNIPNTDAINSNAWASGFWITNVQNTFTGNSIGGCQGQGRGFWYLPINTGTCGTQNIAEPNVPLLSGMAADAGLFADNRAHACYTGLDTAADVGTNGVTISSCPLQPQYNNEDVYTEIEGMTATRNRNRGIWVRPKWYVVDSARVATNRDSISVVSSGGTEGSPPGEWSVVSNSILAGISANNPGRFGPCPYVNEGAIIGNPGYYGCLDEDQVVTAAGGHGYPNPFWNLEGEMLYDGPARLSGNEFVNFLVNPASYLTAPDQGYLAYYESNQAPNVYEGDAAFGWFQSNVNSYPPTQYSENAMFTNTDLRHQVYTADVNLAAFSDGDKNTVLLDESGETLAGYEVVAAGCTAPCAAISGKSAISFNNLPFVSTPNAVDECLAEGGQDTILENRPTALMSPQDYATLEFSMQTPGGNVNNLTFAKDQLDFAGMAGPQSDGSPPVNCPSIHSCINLLGRNQQGVYEPKVINGAAYTVMSTGVGIQQYTDVAFTDATVAGGISSTNPFQIRLSICYQSAKGQPAATGFTVTTGVKSLGQLTSSLSAAALMPYWNMLLCNGLDNANPNYVQDCFGLQMQKGPPPQPANVPLTQLDPTNSNSLATDLAMLQPGQYYYNPTTGFLTFLMQQTSPNGAVPGNALPLGGGPSPLASCTANSPDPCPDAVDGETFYSCPEGGCGLYTVAVTDSTYTPGVSTCTPYGTMGQDYTAPWPSNLNQLAYTNGTPITTTTVASNVVNKVNFPHITDNNPTKACPAGPASATPPWIGSANPAPSPDLTFTLGLPSNVCILGVTGGATVLPSTNLIPLTSQQTYTFMACDGANQCSQLITVTGTQQSDATFTAGAGSCGIASGEGTIAFAGSFTAGTMCTCPS